MGKENIHLLRKMQLEEMTEVIFGIAERDLKGPNSGEESEHSAQPRTKGSKPGRFFVSLW